MAIPPLGQRVLDTGKGAVAFCAEQADRHGQAIDHVQHRHGQDEAQEKPVGDIDMRLRPLDDRADEDNGIADPDDREPEIDIPFGFGIFLGLGHAQQIAGGGQHDEQLVAPENKAGEAGEGQPRPASALDDIETCRDQRIASESKNNGRCVQRAEAPEGGIFQPQIEHGKGELEGDIQTHCKTRHAPEQGRDHAPADRIVVIFSGIGRCSQYPATDGGIVGLADRHPQHDQGRRHDDRHVHCKSAIGSHDHRQKCQKHEQQPAPGLHQ